MLGLPCEPNVPLLGLVGRLVDQKGMDLLLPTLHATLDRRFQFVLLGSGMPFYQEGFKRLARDYPDQVAVTIGYDNSLAHKIEAASDFFVMPSKFEPCGLNQLYSLKYGSVPIVRAVGGLDDSIIGLSESANVATGIKFNDYAVTALEAAKFCSLMGVFGAVISGLPLWNWWEFPPTSTMVCIIDTGITWFLAGLAMGKVLHTQT